jgi:membrane-bound metal-dependent hydrolase YbcI (DUF457 family)
MYIGLIIIIVLCIAIIYSMGWFYKYPYKPVNVLAGIIIYLGCYIIALAIFALFVIQLKNK